tara:strand:+ start:842 stop:1354 length:513 start_codon:yes stop_codon:yes gene_type:complete
MKKILITLPLVFLVSVASAGVTFSGLLLNNPTSEDGSISLTAQSVDWYSDAGGAFAAAISGGDQSIFDSLASEYVFHTTTGLPNGLYTGAFNINALSAGNFDTGNSFVVVINDAHIFSNASWVAPSEGGTASIAPGGGAAALSQVPEPSTYALLAGFAAFLFVAIRRRNA